MAATVWVKPLNGTWQPIGTGVDRGVWHEGLVAISDQVGPKSATFTLKRQQRAAFPDLYTQTPVIIEEGGVRVWRGRIKNTPEQSGATRMINVECEGGQYLIDDDVLERILVHNDLTAWTDQRSFLAANLTKFRTVGQATTGGQVVLSFPKGSDLNGDTRVGVTLDLGPASTAKRLVCDSFSFLNSDGNANFIARGTDTADENGTGETLWTFNAATAPSIQAATFTTARRYLHLVFAHTFTGTAGIDTGIVIGSAKVFADAAYESGNASILSAKMIITDALTRTNLATALHPDWSGIGDPAFTFPNFAPAQAMSPRELIAAANAPIPGWRFKIDENLKPLYRANATVPVIDLGTWLGTEGDSGSSNSDEGIVTRAIVTGTGPDGAPVRSTGSQTGTIIDRQGGVRAKTLTTNFKLNSTLADKLRDAYLASHRVSPFKGQNVVTCAGARRTDSGLPVRPAHLLLLTSELARRTDLVDPDTGALGRTAVIDQVTYRDDDQTAEIDLDNTRRDFEALQERLGLLVPA